MRQEQVVQGFLGRIGTDERSGRAVPGSPSMINNWGRFFEEWSPKPRSGS
ncbi:MAG: hypothetical protein JSR31_01210 [Nitrospira sp.]|nr:hypothetical protein [Nitrospira sp.]